MREIKFRVYNPDTNGMVSTDDTGGDLGAFFIGTQIGWANIHYMQYSGLKDKNGVEIYEGDIVRVQNKTMKVVYDNAAFHTPYYSPNDIPSYYRLGVWDKSIIEIIGNIHQNPDLIK